MLKQLIKPKSGIQQTLFSSDSRRSSGFVFQAKITPHQETGNLQLSQNYNNHKIKQKSKKEKSEKITKDKYSMSQFQYTQDFMPNIYLSSNSELGNNFRDPYPSIYESIGCLQDDSWTQRAQICEIEQASKPEKDNRSSSNSEKSSENNTSTDESSNKKEKIHSKKNKTIQKPIKNQKNSNLQTQNKNTSSQKVNIQKPKPFRQGNVIKQVAQDAVEDLRRIQIYLQSTKIKNKEENPIRHWNEKQINYCQRKLEMFTEILRRKYKETDIDQSEDALNDLINKFCDKKTPKFVRGINKLIYDKAQNSLFDKFQQEAFKQFFKEHIQQTSISLVFNKERIVNARQYLHYLPQLTQIVNGDGFFRRYSSIVQFQNNKWRSQDE